jgi:hypothetical protein
MPFRGQQLTLLLVVEMDKNYHVLGLSVLGSCYYAHFSFESVYPVASQGEPSKSNKISETFRLVPNVKK